MTRIRLGVAIFIGALCCASCATSETVYLKNPAGEVVQCGPYTNSGNIPAANAAGISQVRYCVQDYQRQGYERTPKPTK